MHGGIWLKNFLLISEAETWVHFTPKFEPRLLIQNNILNKSMTDALIPGLFIMRCNFAGLLCLCDYPLKMRLSRNKLTLIHEFILVYLLELLEVLRRHLFLLLP